MDSVEVVVVVVVVVLVVVEPVVVESAVEVEPVVDELEAARPFTPEPAASAAATPPPPSASMAASGSSARWNRPCMVEPPSGLRKGHPPAARSKTEDQKAPLAVPSSGRAGFACTAVETTGRTARGSTRSLYVRWK